MRKKIVRGILWILIIMSVLPLIVLLLSTVSIENILLGFIGAGVGLALAMVGAYPLRRLFLAVEDWLSDD